MATTNSPGQGATTPSSSCQASASDTITDFTAGPNAGPHDLIAFDHTIFADFDAVMAASAQVGASTVITFDAQNTVTSVNVSLGSLHHDDFAFV